MFDRYIVKSADSHRENVRKRDAYLEKRLAAKPALGAQSWSGEKDLNLRPLGPEPPISEFR